MIDVARFHELPVWQVGRAGVLLGDRHGWVMLPPEEAPEGIAPGDRLQVFVTTDKGDHPVATLRSPLGEAGEVFATRVVGENAAGVFVDWGLPKDLFVPWKHQFRRLSVGDRAVVYVTVDETDRPVGYTKLVDVFSTDTREVRVGTEVELLVYGHNEVGSLCVVEVDQATGVARGARAALRLQYSGLLYADRLAGRSRPRIGERLTGFVERRAVGRGDEGKLDLSLTPVGAAGRDHATEVLAAALVEAGGFLPLHDDSPPELIRSRLGLSKKQFKRAVGALYRQRLVVIDASGIRAIR